MDDYYVQAYAASFQSNLQPGQEQRRTSSIDAEGYPMVVDMYGNPMLNRSMSSAAIGVQTDPDTRRRTGSSEMSMAMDLDMGMNMASHSMLEFSNGGGAGGGLGNLEGYQFAPNTVGAGMIMTAGSLFTNPGIASAAASAIQNQQTSQTMNNVNPYMAGPAPFENAMSASNTYGVSPSQKMRMSTGVAGHQLQNIPMPTIPMGFSNLGNHDFLGVGGGVYNMDSQNQFSSLSMGTGMTQNFVPNIVRDSAHAPHDPGGGIFQVEGGQPVRRNSNTIAARRNSQLASPLDTSQMVQQPPHINLQQHQFQQQRMQQQQQQQQQQEQQQQQHQRQQQQQQEQQHQQQQQHSSFSIGSPRPQIGLHSRNPSTHVQSNPAYPPSMQTKEHQDQLPPPNLYRNDSGQTISLRNAPSHSNFINAYSQTGFDMLDILMRVATRKNPEIAIGAVDLSCAFVICDATMHDCPITYCSENFEKLTGYTKHEILGRNCRFLQAPDGKVQAGVKRNYVDDDTIHHLKNMVTAKREAQCSMINYRKGGQPFMNLLTIIPVTDKTEEIKYFVGFQVDLVEQPNSVTNKNPDGSYTINYQRGLTMPRYIYNAGDRLNVPMESGQTINRDDVTTVLTTIGAGESELSRRIWDKVLLENTDDVVFVLSLKGLFFYLSPSCHKVLEYDATELTGTPLSSICHPSDIVPVTRELKDTSSSAGVNVIFRIRRKQNGYMWFEGNGSLHTEQGKGRKSIVLVGRERPVYTLSRDDISASGGIGDNEVWTKLSTSGMFLFVSANIRQLLDKQPEELVGISIQSLMRPESRQDFLRVLEIARTGKRASVKHELLNKRGQVLQAFSTVYPGDATEGQKPTFIIAQTRLVKYSRSSSSSAQRPPILQTLSGSSIASLAEPDKSGGSGGSQVNGIQSRQGSQPQNDHQHPETAMTIAGGQGLELGRQDQALASEENLFDELKTTRSTSWQFELRQMEKRNRLLAEELQGLLAARKKRKRRKGTGTLEKDCANCHTRVTPEWRRGPSGNRDLCNSCGLRWAKQQGRISPRTTTSQRSAHSAASDKVNCSPRGVGHTAKGAGQKSSTQARSDAAVEQIRFPPQSDSTDDAHVAKTAKCEPATSPRPYSGGSVSNLPSKIEEGIDEDGRLG